MVARYPSPLGTTESEVDATAWRAVAGQSAALAALRPGVEAYLMRATGRPGRDEHTIVPLDDCFRLVAVIRRSWTGMSGGSAVWREIAGFFDELDLRSSNSSTRAENRSASSTCSASSGRSSSACSSTSNWRQGTGSSSTSTSPCPGSTQAEAAEVLAMFKEAQAS